jgi:hypothetical protein
MPHFSIPGPLAIAGIFVLIAIFLITARGLIRLLLRPLQRSAAAVGRLLAPIYRVTLRPIVRLLRRLLGALLGLAEAAQPTRPIQVGAAPYKALLHLLDMHSIAETELGEVPRDVKNLLDRRGRLFRSVNANHAVGGVHETLTPEEANRNLDTAGKFYERSIEHGLNPTILYEDSEEALIIAVLKDLDTTFFYVMRRIRRNVSRNIGKVIIIMTAIVIVSPLIISYFAAPLVGRQAGISALIAGDADSLKYVFASAVLIFALVLTRYTYSTSARYNGQQFNHFVQTYFSRLLNQYKSAATAFSNVLNDRIAPLNAVENNANLWFLNMHWLSARQWLLELYVRNMMFQVGRNWMWSLLLMPAVLFAIAFTLFFLLANEAMTILAFTRSLSYQDYKPLASLWTWLPTGVLFVIYLVALTDLLKKFWDEIAPSEWLGFRTMNIKDVIQQTVGPIAREVVDKRRNLYGTQPPPPAPAG